MLSFVRAAVVMVSLHIVTTLAKTAAYVHFATYMGNVSMVSALTVNLIGTPERQIPGHMY